MYTEDHTHVQSKLETGLHLNTSQKHQLITRVEDSQTLLRLDNQFGLSALPGDEQDSNFSGI